MSKSRHTEAQMIGALKQVEAGRAVEDEAVVDVLMRVSSNYKVNSDAPRGRVVDNAVVRSCLADWGEILGPEPGQVKESGGYMCM